MSYGEFLKSGWSFSDKADYEDVLVPRGESCIEISKLIARADEQPGEFSFGGSANMLPVAPGLFVTGAGPICTPLSNEQAEKLIALCTKSPFGHNHDTKMDENVRKSWQLQPDLTQFKHPLWQTGMEKLSRIVAERLGYRGVPLQCILYKLLVYGEGGHFVKHQDTEKEDGMIATVVIQPPSTHERGDLVVYRGEKVTYRHDFGKADGTAAYLPHYAVHYADSEHALEEVTKGFRLVLVYSVCLPRTMRHLKKSLDQPLSELLAGKIEKMDTESDSFALLLDHAYTEKRIRDLGSDALKGVDKSRFHVLDGANALVTEDKKLKLFIAHLAHDIHRYDNGFESELRGQFESIAWFSTDGESHGLVATATTKLNFLNPRRETIADLWLPYEKLTKKGGYTGNEGSTGITTYARFAIDAWVATKHPENALKFMPLDIAAKTFLTGKSLDDVEIQTFLNGASARLEAENTIRKKMDRNFEKRDGNVSIAF